MALMGMSMLSKGKEKIDVMIINVHSPDSFCFELLKQAVALKIVSLSKKAFDDGAFLYFKRPLDKEIVKCLWQFVLSKKYKERKKEEFRDLMNIVDEIGCLAKNIVKEMNVSGLTKNQVSSHLQAQPHYLNPFLSSQNNGPLFGSQGPIIRSTNYKPCLEYNSCDHHDYNMDVNAAHVPTYSSSPMAFNTNIGDVTVNRLGTINTNFPQDVREQNMSGPSNIVTASNVVDIEENDSNEKEDCDLYFNYNDYLKCFNN
ncbi:hypothetical protein H5410_060037 [Solanum commersonii]|uniref:Uncharacterized protein n=1 Tax=Solanum commersonii TaxID=4109 RepID=A0A9J5W4F9_SOLCO|nr:hypothetical protein H5410_060037 [Solanum commersonii]